MSTDSEQVPGAHSDEPHREGLAQRLNWLRAGVLGANDGIVSVAAIVVGVAGATQNLAAILTAGIAGLVGGAVSMALGEYISVSSQRDSERALIEKEKRELAEMPEEEFEELVGLYRAKGLTEATAVQVARELTDHDVLAAHLSAELNIDEKDVVSPWHAAFASAISFTLGAILPMLSILLPPPGWRVPVTFVAVLAALVVTGVVSARLGGAPARAAVVRNVVVGLLAMVVTFAVGSLFSVGG